MTDDDSKYIQLPAPTPGPLVASLGITLICSGIVTHWTFSVIGFVLAVYGAIYWFKDIYPHEKHEASEIVPSIFHDPELTPRTVEHLHLGESGHRKAYPAKVHPYISGLYGGLVGGVVMAILALGYGALVQKSIWWPVNLLAGSVLPGLADANRVVLHAFNLPALLTGIFVHGGFSIMVGLLYAAILPMFPRLAWLWAGILMPLLWSGLFYSTAQYINPVMPGKVDWPWFVVCQIAFGLTAGYVVAKSQKIDTLHGSPRAVRFGVEAMRKGDGGPSK